MSTLANHIDRSRNMIWLAILVMNGWRQNWIGKRQFSQGIEPLNQPPSGYSGNIIRIDQQHRMCESCSYVRNTTTIVMKRSGNEVLKGGILGQS